ncbi:uncharacterized protein LOC126680887 [Mercurialis annua]|uniref:uncharacterized protein LOC126680887 n=1 Tax=Mercurialis annua TaxID=3986 RepID=UPI00215EE15E|nr:uncharacterized protein LOC126680887 [Mercurialis annua]
MAETEPILLPAKRDSSMDLELPGGKKHKIGDDEDADLWKYADLIGLEAEAKTLENFRLIKKFLDQIAESDGFDVDPYHGPPILGGVNLLNLEEKNIWTKGCRKAVPFAIRVQNARRTKRNRLKLVKIIKCNLNGCTFFATFEAKSDPEGTQIYQAQILYPFCGPTEEGAEVVLFRQKRAG